MTKRYIPRWLYTEATVLANWIKIPPGTLQNDTIWPMRVEHISVAGVPIVDNVAMSGLAGIGDLVVAEIGTTQEGDINAVPAILNGSFSCIEPSIGMNVITLPSFTFHLRHPYRLSRDNGFLVRRRRRTDTGVGGGAVTLARVHIVFRGVDIVTGLPVILGGTNENQPTPWSSTVTFNSADLHNRGVHDVDIYSVTVESQEGSAGACGVADNYLINPILGERWMPGETEIPAGCLAPYGFMGLLWQAAGVPTGDIGPHTFVFPDGVYIHRRQEIALRLSRSFYAVNQPVNVALFGYLEVE